jgi:ribosomal protein S12 methylthiotransferase accessory factor
MPQSVRYDTPPGIRFPLQALCPMTTENCIAGKDVPLETTIATLRERLAARGFRIEEKSWLNPVEGVWSVHVRDADCALLYTNGKGATRLAALASALGEFCERLACGYFWSHYYLGAAFAHGAFAHDPRERWFPLPESGDWPADILTPELQSFYNPEDSIGAAQLVDLNTGNAERGICCLPYERVSGGATVWFPVNVIGNLYVSNGMAAGNSAPEARAQALSEILERHVKFRVIAESLCLPEVPAAVIARYPRIEAGIAVLRAAGFGILVRDASLGGLYPVLNVTLLHPEDQGCFASFGAHPHFEIALERALTELLQGRALDALGGFPEPGFDEEEVASAPNLEIHFVDSSGVIAWRFLADQPDFEFCDWNFGGATSADDYRWLLDCIAAAGYDIYVAEFTQLGVYACRILVPGMSEIYPLDDLEWENNGVGGELRAAVLALPGLDEDSCVTLLERLQELGTADERPVAALIGLAADAGSFWADLRVGELKLLLALAADDDEAILEGCAWTRQFGQLDSGRACIYRCVEALLQLEGDVAYAGALLALYGADTLDRAQALLDGQLGVLGFAAPGLELAGCEEHRGLLAAYAKMQAGRA